MTNCSRTAWISSAWRSALHDRRGPNRMIKQLLTRPFRMYRTYAQIPNNISLVRHVLLMPFIFETLSTILQMRDLRRRARIERTAITDPHLQKVVAYNAGMTRSGFTRTRRTEKCYEELTYPYARLPYLTSGQTDTQMVGKRLEDERLLIVGPRNVHELLAAWLYGYRWKNIHAVDLYSTNPKILQMNMNALGFKSESFDAVSVYSTLAYSKDIRATLTEIARVLKPTGRLVFQIGYSAGDDNRPAFAGELLRGEDLRRHLKELGLQITAFRTTYAGDRGAGQFGTDYFFSVQKLDPAALGFDVINW
jgi:SAM-dependent methyltransferase